LVITDTYISMAGSERNVTQLLTGVDKDRFELYVASIRSGRLGRDMREQGYQIFDLRNAGIYTRDGLRNIRFLRGLIREKGISLIVSYHEASDFYGLVLAKLCGIPVISSRRDMGYKTKRHHSLAYKAVGRFFDAQITVCRAVKQEMVDRGWFPAERIVPIYNGIDLSRYGTTKDPGAVKEGIGIDRSHPLVGMVAHVRRIKGIKHFVEAAAIIHKRNPDVHFVVIGHESVVPGHTRQDYDILTRSLGVHENVHFLGSRRDIPELISSFDVAVVSSLSEGFSNTILEYMASSKPVVATRVGGNPEAVEHGKTGLLVPPGDAAALAEAIGRLLDDKTLAVRYGEAGRRKAEELYGLDRMIRNYEALFERVLSAKANSVVFTGGAVMNEQTGAKSP
jgi:glycosyltransferase involved in cell wall biosynthesis